MPLANDTSSSHAHAHLTAPPKLKGGLPGLGHMVSFARNPYLFTKRVADTLGEIASFKLLGQRIVLLTGDEASQLFYRSSDEQLDQSAAYKLMTPIFGEGLVFDAPNARKNEQLKMLMPSLRVDAMRSHSAKVVLEVEHSLANWGEQGELDLVHYMKELTINTASHCLLGKEFRYELNKEFASIYSDLEAGVHPIAYHFPNLPLPRFRRRDKARARLQELVGGIIDKRQNQTQKPDDLFQSLIDMHYEDGTKLSANEVTGMLVGAIFAGHHTSSGTAAWVLLELLKHPEIMRRVRTELDDLLGFDGEVTFESLRQMPVLDSVVKEVLRLHPPLIILMRQVSQPLVFKDYRIEEGDMVWACPPVTHRLSNLFSNPEAFDPDRFSPERAEDKNLMAYQPFGGGKHKCSGNAFATFQIKAIFAVLLRRFEFELTDAPSSYVDDYHEMIVQPKAPCRVRYRRRKADSFPDGAKQQESAHSEGDISGCPFHQQKQADLKPVIRVKLDRDLCQGHGVCTGEDPERFSLAADGSLVIASDVVDEDDFAKAKKAADYCPNKALTVELDDPNVS